MHHGVQRMPQLIGIIQESNLKFKTSKIEKTILGVFIMQVEKMIQDMYNIAINNFKLLINYVNCNMYNYILIFCTKWRTI